MASVQVGTNIQHLYKGYYGDSALEKKRAITARETLAHIRALVDGPVESLVDVGAGQGSLVELVSKAGLAKTITALEISDSGMEVTAQRGLPNLTIKKFDGYRSDCHDKEFELAACVHVLEHVEHERALLHEIKRISRPAVIEVPLENNLNLQKISRSCAHMAISTSTRQKHSAIFWKHRACAFWRFA